MNDFEKLAYVLIEKHPGPGYFKTEGDALQLRLDNVGSDEPVSEAVARQTLLEKEKPLLAEYNIPVPAAVSVSKSTRPRKSDLDPKDEYAIIASLDISGVDMEKVRNDFDSLREANLRKTAKRHAAFIADVLRDEHASPHETAQILASVIHDVRNTLHPSKHDKAAVMSALQTRLTSTDRGEPQR